MKGSEIDDPGHLIGLKPRRFPNWGARQQPIKICPLCSIHVDRTGHCLERVFTTHNRTPYEHETETRNMTIQVTGNTTQHNQNIKPNTLQQCRYFLSQ